MSPAAAVAALGAAAAVLLLRPPPGWVLRRIRPRPPRHLLSSPRPGTSARPGSARPPIRSAAAAAVVAAAVLLPPAAMILAWTGTAIAVTVTWRLLRSRARVQAQVRRDHCHELIEALVAELRGGAPPAAALARLVPEFAFLSDPARVAAVGGDVPEALRVVAERHGAVPLADVARAWAVSERTGAPLGEVLERVRDAVRADRAIEREIAAGVGPARATITLVVAIPPLGLALGSGLGVDPWAVVTTTLPGALCVALGTGFAIAGVLWVDRVADQVEVGR